MNSPRRENNSLRFVPKHWPGGQQQIDSSILKAAEERTRLAIVSCVLLSAAVTCYAKLGRESQSLISTWLVCPLTLKMSWRIQTFAYHAPPQAKVYEAETTSEAAKVLDTGQVKEVTFLRHVRYQSIDT